MCIFCVTQSAGIAFRVVLRIAIHTKTRNNTGSFGTRTNNTTIHTKLGTSLKASELESITLKERKLEIVLILEEQIQLC